MEFEDGKLTVRSVYNLARNTSVSASSGAAAAHPVIWNHISEAKVAPKIRNLWLRVASGIIPVMSKLVERRLNVVNICCVCETPDETIEHVFFFYCAFAVQVWALEGVDVRERPMHDAMVWLIKKSIQLGCLERNMYHVHWVVIMG